MRVYSELLAVLCSVLPVERRDTRYLLREQRAEAVYDVNNVHRRLPEQVERNADIRLLRIGDSHYIAGNFVALCNGVLDNVDSGRDLVDICGNADNVDRAFSTGLDVLLVVASANVRHYGDLEIGVVVAYYRADILVVAELPLAEILYVEHLLISLIAELHNVHARLDVGLIQILYELVRETEIIHQTSVAQGRVNYLYIRSVIHQLYYFFHDHCPFIFSFALALLCFYAFALFISKAINDDIIHLLFRFVKGDSEIFSGNL